MDDWLDQFGRRIIDDLESSPPEFLIEWRVTRVELDQLCEALGRAKYEIFGRDRQTALAVAAVQIAAHAEGDERGFRQLFFRRLGISLDLNLWETALGPAILRVLDRYFPETVSLDRTGPFRYVSPIYRHSGLPGKAISTFARVLAAAVRSYGTIFSYEQYRLTLPKLLPRLVREFLRSPAGYQFTLQSARLFTRIRSGLISRAELADVSGYRHNFWPELLEHLEPGTSAAQKSSKLPWLALDTNSLRLVLRFDPNGVTAGRYFIAGRVVTLPEVPLTHGRPPAVLLGESQIRWQPDSKLWWWPSAGSAALFRASDGAFVASAGAVRPGTYYLVLSGDLQPEASIVQEELGALALSDQDEHPSYYFVYRVNMPPSFQLGNTSLSTTSGLDLPQLHLEGFRHPRLGNTVFVHEPPRLRIEGWSAQASTDYWLLLNDGIKDRRLDLSGESAEMSLQLPVPCHARVWIESRGFKRQLEALPELQFTVIPRGFQFRWLPSVSSSSDSSALLARFPRGWTLDTGHENVSSSPAKIGVPPTRRILDLRLRHLTFELPVSLEVPRATAVLIGDPGESVAWLEDAEAWIGFHLEAPAGHSASVCLRETGRMTTLCDVGRMPRTGAKDVPLIEFRDALQTAHLLNARVMLRFRENTYVPTELHVVSAERTRQALLDDKASDDIFDLPGVGAVLRAAKDVLEHPARDGFQPAVRVPESLRLWLEELAGCAHAFDSDRADTSADPVVPAPSEYEDLRRWVWQARRARYHLAQVPPFPKALESITQGKSTARWRQELAILRGPALDVAGIVTEWKDALDATSALSQIPDCALARMGGGLDLSRAYRKYRLAVTGEPTPKIRQRLFVTTCKSLEAATQQADDGVLVAAIANALRQLVLYRMGDTSATQQITIDISEGPLACLATSTRALSASVQGVACVAQWPAGIGFAEISPFSDDAQLERTLGRCTPIETIGCE